MLIYGLILFYVGQYFICIASVPNKMYIGTKFVFIKIWITEIYKCSYIFDCKCVVEIVLGKTTTLMFLVVAIYWAFQFL